MATQALQPGESRSKLSQSTGASSNTYLTGNQQQWRYQLVYCDTANAATDNMTQIAHYAIVCKTGDSKNGKQNAIGREYIRIELNGYQLKVKCKACIQRELHNQSLVALKRKPPCWNSVLVSTVRKIKHLDVVISEIISDDVRYWHPPECVHQALITSEDTPEECMVKVILESQ
jgi:hypothetical protein